MTLDNVTDYWSERVISIDPREDYASWELAAKQVMAMRGAYEAARLMRNCEGSTDTYTPFIRREDG